MASPSREPAQPHFFGHEARPLFGWLHRSPQGTSPRLGLVVCNPFGYEAICSHRSLRHFADASAAAGVPALRFDQDGTGDSAGSDLDPDRLDAWLDSIRRAADQLRSLTGVEKVVLFGVRLGGTLALLASQARPDVEGVVAFAPVVNGRMYLRELRALHAACALQGAPNPDKASTEDVQEAVGFVLTSQTREELGRLDLHSLPTPVPPHALILERDDLKSDERLPNRLAELGCAVERRRVPGYVQMMLDPHNAVPPQQAIDTTVAWLATLAAQLGASSPRPQPATDTAMAALRHVAHLHEVAGSVLESAVILDPQTRLFGVLSAPATTGIESAHREGVLFLNSGSIYRVGPNRMFLRLARDWAARGYYVLRLDISGIGDSPPRPGESENHVYTERANEDIAAAVAYLRNTAGCTNVSAVGLCSGAYNAFKSALYGSGIEHTILVNPLTFFWKPGMPLDARESMAASAGQRALSSPLAMLKRALSNRRDFLYATRLLSHYVAIGVSRLVREVARRMFIVLPADLGSELLTLSRKRVRISFVFGAREPGLDLLRLQGGSAVGKLLRKGALEISIIENTDHTFTAAWAQRAICRLLDEKLSGARELQA